MKFNNFTITICFLFSPYLTERQDTSFSQVYSLLNNAVKIHTQVVGVIRNGVTRLRQHVSVKEETSHASQGVGWGAILAGAHY
jgi:hypothetical protein